MSALGKKYQKYCFVTQKATSHCHEICESKFNASDSSSSRALVAFIDNDKLTYALTHIPGVKKGPETERELFSLKTQ